MRQFLCYVAVTTYMYGSEATYLVQCSDERAGVTLADSGVQSSADDICVFCNFCATKWVLNDCIFKFKHSTVGMTRATFRILMYPVSSCHHHQHDDRPDVRSKVKGKGPL